MITTTQIILCGVAFDVEIEFSVDEADPSVGAPEVLHIDKAYLLSAFPEGIDSSKKIKNAVYLNLRADLEYLTIEEYDTLENACWEHHRLQLAEAWDR